jgi:hypothetical protein
MKSEKREGSILGREEGRGHWKVNLREGEEGSLEVFLRIEGGKLSKIWVWDPGSGKNLFQGSKRHRIPDTDPQHCY